MDLFKKVLDVPVQGDTQAKDLSALVRAQITLVHLSGWRGWIFTRAFNKSCRRYIRRYGDK